MMGTGDAFLVGVVLIYLIAIWSIYVQHPGLSGPDGLVPVAPLSSLWSWDALMLSSGCLASAMLICRSLRFSVSYACLFMAYRQIFLTHSPWLSFQWDILLLEVLAVAALASPVLPGGGRGSGGGGGPAVWLARFLLFKLMLMAGVVKLQSHCPTWLGLTATQYHFATQCLPNKGGWWAHQAPPLVHQAAVALTLVIEVPAPFLLLAPEIQARRLGVALQLALQLGIMLTGNYNFFNILTVVLCIPCWEEVPTAQQDAGGQSTGGRRVGRLVALGLLSGAAAVMFHYDGSRLHLQLAPEVLTSMLIKFLPIFFSCVGAGLLVSCSHHARGAKGPVDLVCRLLRCTGVLCLFSLSALDFRSLHPKIVEVAPLPVRQLASKLQPLRLTSSYGLFRRMTGVGSEGQVSRPEIIISGSLDGHRWNEIEFKYKPGDVATPPKQVAPHQPRLDWQMWFAALADYQHYPFIVSLMNKIHHGCPTALHLLDGSRYPFLPSEPPLYLKADLFHYDFTQQNVSVPPAEWWVRSWQREYLPVLERDNESLLAFLEAHGLPKGCQKPHQYDGSATLLIRQEGLWWPVVLSTALVCWLTERSVHRIFSKKVKKK